MLGRHPPRRTGLHALQVLPLPPSAPPRRVDVHNFIRTLLSILLSDEHGFEKPNDARALDLMNACAVALAKEFPDIRIAFGESDEYR